MAPPSLLESAHYVSSCGALLYWFVDPCQLCQGSTPRAATQVLPTAAVPVGWALVECASKLPDRVLRFAASDWSVRNWTGG
mmetsp:Transcript_15474/g.37196  ORF Transcript_15474/g.37196 Transcript_15474/m.37196 type:complete len:81 (-) Transcript_15474:49-291(-)